MGNNLALIKAEDLALVNENSLNSNQLSLILKKTPPQYVKKRPAKGGGEWKYVTGGYVRKCLNLMFGWDWDFEIMHQMVLHDEAIVQGKLTVRSNGKSIIKTQFGNKEVIYKKQLGVNNERVPLSIGNDLKAAATDCLKKCAAEIGIAADIYNAEDFKEVFIDTSKVELEDLELLYDMKKDSLTNEEKTYIERILKNKEENSYKKLHTLLQSK